MGDTALHVAAYRGHIAIVEDLVQSGADVNAELGVSGLLGSEHVHHRTHHFPFPDAD